MVGFSAHDAETAVQLFKQDHPHQLVREGHPGKTEAFVRTGKDLRGKAERTADDEAQMALSGDAERFDLPGEFDGIRRLPFDRKGDHVRVLRQAGKEPCSFLFADRLVFGR